MSEKIIISKNQVKDFIFIPDPELCYLINSFYHFEGLGLLQLKINNEIISCNSIIHENNEIEAITEFQFFTSNIPPNNIRLKLNLKVTLNGILRDTFEYFEFLIEKYKFSFEELVDNWIEFYELNKISCKLYFKEYIWEKIKDV